MKRKVIASASIFTLLFLGAWMLAERDKHEFYTENTNMGEETTEIMPLTYTREEVQINQLRQTGRYKPFRSREYVRVEGL